MPRLRCSPRSHSTASLLQVVAAQLRTSAGAPVAVGNLKASGPLLLDIVQTREILYDPPPSHTRSTSPRCGHAVLLANATVVSGRMTCDRAAAQEASLTSYSPDTTWGGGFSASASGSAMDAASAVDNDRTCQDSGAGLQRMRHAPPLDVPHRHGDSICLVGLLHV